jgi:pullulanase
MFSASKKDFLSTFVLLFLMNFMFAQPGFTTYFGADLGSQHTPEFSTFRVWSPVAKSVKLRLYNAPLPKSADSADLIEAVDMEKSVSGTWLYKAMGERKGQFYTYQVTTKEGVVLKEVADIYAKAVGTNGLRAMVVNLEETNPKGWKSDKSPKFAQKTDAIIYELHVRDASIDENSGIKNKGKFLGLSEIGTRSPGADGIPTGLDHIASLGVTHVHLLPFYDYFTVDESIENNPKYNWGYDPLNYNTTEGSYSTNPHDGVTRIREAKQMIQAMHKKGLRVVMDVVYNHTMFGEESYFHQLVPFYYHRTTADGKFSNASACGNETASDKPMMRKFMIESLIHWVKEYHIDGFRFDLMGIHDIETMNQISLELHKIKPDILLYGEGWTAGDSPLPENKRALKKFALKLDRVAAFSDDMRDAIKGSVFDHNDRGFASGKFEMIESIKFGVVAATKHPQIKFDKVNYSKAAWAGQPYHCINYAECHDNHTLWDRLLNSNPNASVFERTKMYKLAQSIVLTAQGIPFLHAGAEFMRTKNGAENSYNLSDTINKMDWARAKEQKTVVEYFRQLIKLRKAHPAFRLPTADLVARHIEFLPTAEGVLAYKLKNNAGGDKCKNILVIYNAQSRELSYDLPVGKWRTLFSDKYYGKKSPELSAKVKLDPISTLVLAEW